MGVDIERKLAANSALRRNKNMEYSKNDEPTSRMHQKRKWRPVSVLS